MAPPLTVAVWVTTHAPTLTTQRSVAAHRRAISEIPKWKRTFDVVVALFLLVFFSPLLIAISALVAMDGGPIIHRHRRAGMNARPFDLLKFRVVCHDAEQGFQELLECDKGTAGKRGKHQKLRGGPGTTRIGQFLRRSSLDELPQLVNVLTGSMSIVGPRPIAESQTLRYGQYIRHYYHSRPGITGLSQVNGCTEVSCRRRVALDKIYARKNSRIGLDLKVIALTLSAVFLSQEAR